MNNSQFSILNSQFPIFHQQNCNTILLVEDNPKILAMNTKALVRHGYKVVQAETISRAKAIFESETPSLIILDIMLPDGSGLELCEEIRASNKSIPILFLSALGSGADVKTGYETGGDDYLPKPYDLDMLITRVKALLRRAELLPEKITKGSLSLSVSSNEAFINGENIGIGKDIEFSLLCHFAQNENIVLSHEQIYQKVWGKPMIDDAQALKSAVKRLRPKIKGSGYTISSEYGTGFKFEKSML